MFEQEERDTAPEQDVSAAAEETEPPETAAPEAGEPAAAEQGAAPEPPAEQGEPAADQAEAAADEAPADEAPAADEAAPAAEAAAPSGDETAPAAEETEPEAPAGDAAEEQAPRITELAADARYFATGKRKTSVARVILRPGSGSFDLNGRSLEVYFPRRTLQAVVRQPLAATGLVERIDVRARIHGGGISSQADAVRHGIAKALIEAEPSLRGELKRRQLLTRDPRVKERRKAGLKKARKRPQFSKR
jgi:small subunit ribosomal protein S9